MRPTLSRQPIAGVRFQSTHPVWDATQHQPARQQTRRKFQSTHPVWDATSGRGTTTSTRQDFNPRIPYGMRRNRAQSMYRGTNFNPRIPYGMRLILYGMLTLSMLFQSTHPVWDATFKFFSIEPVDEISIHASRMGCDDFLQMTNVLSDISIHASRMGCDILSDCVFNVVSNFNPRIPYGMRLREWTLHSIIWKLLPALRADYIADIPEHLSVCIFGL